MKRLFLLSIVALLFVGCSKVVLTGRKQLLLVSDSEVLAMSATAYKQFVDSVPPSKNISQTTLVRNVGLKIASSVENYLKANGLESELANLKWEFHLVRDSNVNAFCMPGGKVVFYEGIIPVARTEAGIAVVMGHEIAHAVAKHSNERMSHQMLAQYGSGIAGLAFSKKSALMQQTIGTLFGLGANVGFILPYSRKHEYEADRLGLIFMAMAGYDPNEAVAFWQRMSASSKGSVQEFMSTHPSDESRIAQMKAVLPEALGYYRK